MRIVYVVSAMFPYGWAYATRARNLAKMITECGHEVTVICSYLSDGMQWDKNGISSFGNVNIITTTSLYASERTLKDKLFVSKKLKPTLKEYLENNTVDCIICSQSEANFETVYKISQQNGIPLILEVCEWYSHKNWKLGYFDIRYWRFKYIWKYQIIKVKKAICISRLLQKHFSKYGVDTIRIPTVIDTDRSLYKVNPQSNKTPRLIFIGGITGGKDEIATLISCVCNKNKKIEVFIYGPDEKDVYGLVEKNDIKTEKFKERIHIMGHIDQRKLEDKLIECDYGILIRPQRRSSNAGFPTKLGEYFSAGLPVIANDTGDIGLYVKDNENGFVMGDNSKEEIDQVLERISIVSQEKYAEMSRKAREEAEKSFKYSAYCDSIDELIRK
ncbi:glycosyltransferase family 4 protein [Clostridium paraputrificum]|uniref:Glycosyltransferase subfamily 4-like N-terminal domain-containing protein n=1 Tax=Clostridium paraputrificum TaxID=29363 RepID=A0A1B8RS59_9CLOT|nr:glycosyltransferase family 4 protein [Clostridium paraputrificum]OBY11668.1 hypothetical protein CP373A1_04555 [Clostridium paraputrificum]